MQNFLLCSFLGKLRAKWDRANPSVVRPGLRERKKQQTRETIARVALQLFAERGYDHTTLAEIADAADVSPRTIFAYFQSKEDILFCDEPVFFERLKRTLEQRPPGRHDGRRAARVRVAVDGSDEHARLRKKIIGGDEALRLSERARSARDGAADRRIDRQGPRRRARTTSARALSPRPMTAAFNAVRDRLEAESGEPISHEQAMAILDQVLEFLRGGLEALQRS